MGFWGVGLYSGDFAMDLRAAVAAVARLPLAPDELVAILRGVEAAAADDPSDADHTTFWLVLADQLARRGVYPEEVRRRALEIIDGGQDLAQLDALGAGAADLRKRQVRLEEIRAALMNPVERSRKVLSGPQPRVMEEGEVYAYPTSRGNPINPYFKSKDLVPNWSQDGWGVFVVIETGHVFGYLAWYRVMSLEGARSAPPDIAALWGEPLWELRRPGTCPRLHKARMELHPIGAVSIQAEDLMCKFPALPSPRTAVIIDKSIANHLHVGPRPAYSAQTQSKRAWVHGLAEVARPSV